MKTPLEEYPLYDVPEIRALRDILLRGAAVHPDNLAVADLNPTPLPRLSYAALASAVARFGAALLTRGLSPRDHIAVISENRVQWGVAYLAAVCHNLVVVPIDAKLRENEILTILRASGARAAVFSENFRDMFDGFRHSTPRLDVLIDMDLPVHRDHLHSMMEMIAGEKDPGAGVSFPDTDPDAMAVIVFTSGSMGSAKGVMLSQTNICANLRGMLQMVDIPPTDRFLSVLPIHHTYECTCGFLCPLVTGASVHYARSLKSIADDMVSVKPTIVLGVPLLFEKMYRRIMQAIAEKKAVARLLRPIMTVVTVLEGIGLAGARRKLFHEVHERFGGAIRLLIVGGAAPDPEIARGFRMLGFGFIQGYGLTETAPIVALNRARKFRDEAAGLPLPGVTVRIAEPDAEERGEILVSGPNVMLGYYNNPDATNAVLREGWFNTGDVGSIDQHGFLHINGRRKNVIIARNGKNVFPEEIEEHVNKIPCVLESMVYGDRSETDDEIIAVLIVPDANAVYDRLNADGTAVTPEAVAHMLQEEITRLNKRLPVYKQIRKVRIKDTEFEKTTTQKIKRYLVEKVDTE
ncbi:MAG: AMP-binding protein [Bacteroidota bacterium]|jgi:long-chain acyl-CoA synthetase|nr:AMP-binding protein [Bacteroidota bacterium]